MNRLFRYLLFSAMWFCCMASWAQTSTDTDVRRDSLGRRIYQIHAITRGYPDNIIVRWALPDYASWKTLNAYGYRVERLSYHNGKTDRKVIAKCLKPYTEQEFADHFPTTDSLALAAAGLLYGQGLTFEDTQAPTNSGAALLEIYEQQQQRFAYTMLLAEVRPDLATAMGLAIIDRTARPGQRYQYTITPLLPAEANFVVEPHITTMVGMGEWQPETYNPVMTDSLAAPQTVILTWPVDDHQQFYFERRSVSPDGQSTSPWQRLNQLPYVPLRNAEMPSPVRNYLDTDVPLGTYDYRILTLDAFGVELLPGDPHRVEVTDIVPPLPPSILRFDLLRGDTIMQAVIHFEKDDIEPDLVGYMPYYSNNKLFGEGLVPLSHDTITDLDSHAILVEVTGFPSGEISLAAFDRAGNISMSMPMPFFVADLEGPSKPTNLHAEVTIEGQLTLNWSPCPEPDLKFYQVFMANDLKHTFVADPHFASKDTCYVDTLSLNAMQLYSYYYVMATDYTGNSSPTSDTIRVERPNPYPPSICHLERLWDDDSTDHISMIWYGSVEPDIRMYRIYRRMERPGDENVTESDWTLVTTIPAEDVVDDRIIYTDSVPTDPKRRYIYAVESINRTGVSSGLSHEHAIRHRGPNLIPIKFELSGRYRQDDRAAVLAWDSPALELEYLEAGPYICIYRRYEDDIFRFLTSIRISQNSFSDYSLPRGEEADYQIRLRLDDGRFGPLSNAVHIVNTLPPSPQDNQ